MADAIHDDKLGLSPSYTPQTTYPEVSFRLKDVPPPSSLYIAREDRLWVTSFNSAAGFAFDVHARVLMPSGTVVPISVRHTPNSDRSAKTTVIDLAEGFLLNVFAAPATGSAKRGQCYVAIGMGRGDLAARVDHMVLLQGYVGTGIFLGWPGDRLAQPGEGPGFIRFITGTVPGAGAEITEAVPTGARWKLIATRFTLTTSAAAGNRRPSIAFTNGTTRFFRSQAARVLAASLSDQWNFAIELPIAVTIAGTDDPSGLPSNLILPGGWDWRTATNIFDAADQYTAPLYVVEEWIDP